MSPMKVQLPSACPSARQRPLHLPASQEPGLLTNSEAFPPLAPVPLVPPLETAPAVPPDRLPESPPPKARRTRQAPTTGGARTAVVSTDVVGMRRLKVRASDMIPC